MSEEEIIKAELLMQAIKDGKKVSFTYDYRTIVPSVKRITESPNYIGFYRFYGSVCLSATRPKHRINDVVFEAQEHFYCLKDMTEIQILEDPAEHKRYPCSLRMNSVYIDADHPAEKPPPLNSSFSMGGAAW